MRDVSITIKNFIGDFDELQDAYFFLCAYHRKEQTPQPDDNYLTMWDEYCVWAHIYDSVTRISYYGTVMNMESNYPKLLNHTLRNKNMKKLNLRIILVMLLLINCTGSTKSNTYRSLPRFTEVAEGKYGSLLKYNDGDNLIYLYERSSGGTSISVVTQCNH